MRTSLFTNVAVFAATAAAQLRLPVAQHRAARSSSLDRRELGAVFTGAGMQYSVDVAIGTPPQEISLALSSAGDSTWVASSEDCEYYFRCSGGSYNFSASSSYVESEFSSTFSVSYTDGSFVSGSTFEDTIRVGDAELTGLTMGIANYGNVEQGQLALGKSSTGDFSFAELLVEQSITTSRGYSFWLDSSDASSGNILFGAVDTSAFEGTLQRLPASTSRSSYYGLPLDLSVLNFTHPNGGEPEVIATEDDLPLLLMQPENMISNFPLSIAKKIWALAGATYNSVSGAATIPCSGGKSSASELIIGLGTAGAVTVKVRFEDLIIPQSLAPWVVSGSSNLTEGTCVFAIQNIPDSSQSSDFQDALGPWSLGGIVLRNTYTAFDLVNEEIAFAPVIFTNAASGSEDIVQFSTYGAHLPHSEDVEPASDCISSGYCNGDGSSRYNGRLGSHTAPVLLIIVIVIVSLVIIGIIALCVCCLWFKGCCCFKGKREARNQRKAEMAAAKAAKAAAEARGAISEKVVYAGALPPVLPPAQAYAPQMSQAYAPQMYEAYAPQMSQAYAPAGPMTQLPAVHGAMPPPDRSAPAVPDAGPPADPPVNPLAVPGAGFPLVSPDTRSVEPSVSPVSEVGRVAPPPVADVSRAASPSVDTPAFSAADPSGSSSAGPSGSPPIPAEAPPPPPEAGPSSSSVTERPGSSGPPGTNLSKAN